MPGLNTPTLQEQGVDVELENWKALFAPPGVTEADRRWLEETVVALSTSDAWHQTLQRYRWNDRVLTGPALTAFIQTEEARLRAITRKIRLGSAHASAAYPTAVGIAFVVLMVSFIFRMRSRKQPTAPAAHTAWWAMILIGVGVIIELVLLEYLGFIIASAVLFWLTARAFESRHPLRDVASAVVVSAGAYALFAKLLDLSLPTGILAGWL